MYKSVILPLAKVDIQEAALWYNKQQNGLGKRFTAEVREKVHLIIQNPKASNIRYNSVRTAVLMCSRLWFTLPLTKKIKP